MAGNVGNEQTRQPAAAPCHTHIDLPPPPLPPLGVTQSATSSASRKWSPSVLGTVPLREGITASLLRQHALQPTRRRCTSPRGPVVPHRTSGRLAAPSQRTQTVVTIRPSAGFQNGAGGPAQPSAALSYIQCPWSVATPGEGPLQAGVTLGGGGGGAGMY